MVNKYIDGYCHLSALEESRAEICEPSRILSRAPSLTLSLCLGLFFTTSVRFASSFDFLIDLPKTPSTENAEQISDCRARNQKFELAHLFPRRETDYHHSEIRITNNASNYGRDAVRYRIIIANYSDINFRKKNKAICL